MRTLARLASGCASLALERCLALSGVPVPRTILIIGHMRSGSSLLLHLLLSRPEMLGMGERNAPYAWRGDLALGHLATRHAAGAWRRRATAVVDQLNHNNLTPPLALLCQPRVRPVLLLREPAPTLASLLQMSRQYYRDTWSAARAIDYYCGRLGLMQSLAQTLPADCGAVSLGYEELIREPAECLRRLAARLGAAGEFTAQYPVFGFTRRRGDPGPLIATGVIQAAREHDPSLLEAVDLAPARAAHAECARALARFALMER